MKSAEPAKKKRAKKSSETAGRRSGADRRQNFITPYMKFVYNGDEKRTDEERRKGEERRKESQKKE